ncbi:hypothetical protein D210916BOD24_28250 [Alteromonas sp. D210916BOD_24]|uniref:hypothetical protein n=1 Tax=Alteromonas sp. D210916BOD_24 TaxID=3157618 RepID=UPI00399CEE04
MKNQPLDDMHILPSQLNQICGGVAIESLPEAGDPVEVPKDPIYISLELGQADGLTPDMQL